MSIGKVVAGTLDTVTASMASIGVTDTQQEVLDECVQLHGGYGYMNEYLVVAACRRRAVCSASTGARTKS